MALKDSRGQSNIEYILVIGIVVCALLFIITQFGGKITGMFTSHSDKVADTDAGEYALESDPIERPGGGTSSSDTVKKEEHIAVVPANELPAEPSFISRILPWVLLVLVFCFMIAIVVTKMKQRRMLREMDDLDEFD